MNGTTTPAWVNVRKTNNFNSQAPVTDVTSADFRCYDSQTNPTAQTITVAAGQQLGIMSDGTIYHPGVVNVYMAKAPSDVDSFAGDGAVWFKVYQISAVTDGGKSITFPAEGVPGVSFTLPTALPSGQYLVRMEAIALHVAQSYGGAQFYVSVASVRADHGLGRCAHWCLRACSTDLLRTGERRQRRQRLAWPSRLHPGCLHRLRACFPRFIARFPRAQ